MTTRCFPVRIGEVLVVAGLLVGVTACDGDQSAVSYPGVEFAVERDGAGGSDASEQSDADAGAVREAVEVDLGTWMREKPPRTSGARAYRVTRQEQLNDGPVSRARVGDYVLENDRIRVFVERFDESMTPCPYGGNIVDAEYKIGGGETSGDVLGEICPMLNVGQTFKPERFSILRDGTETGVAVVAATGRVEVLDFLNLRVMAPPEVAGLIDSLPFDPDVSPPLAMTIYYILNDGASSVQVVTAFRNDGEDRVDAVVGHMVKSGGHGSYFNPLNEYGGFGYRGLGRDNLDGVPVSFLGYRGASASYAYVPEQSSRIRAELPAGAVQLAISGVAVTLLGQRDVASTLLASEVAFRNSEGVMHLKPGASEVVTHRLYVGDGRLSSMLDRLYPDIGVSTGRLTGKVVDTEGEPVEEAFVTAVGEGPRSFNQTKSGEDGEFSMRAPSGRTYRILARKGGQATSDPPVVRLRKGETERVAPTINRPGVLIVGVENPDEEAVPGRVSVKCVGSCPNPPTAREHDVHGDSLPGGFIAVEPTGPGGEAEVRLMPGKYRVSVSRGIEYSQWPTDASETGGELVEVRAGERTPVRAEIARVVDTSGAMSGDFHVHGVRSPDSTVRKHDRVADFVSNGVEVLVSTDHDVITDYQPTVEQMGMQEWVVGVIGDEITTSDIGHFNGFPLEFEPDHRGGGALDWGRGGELNLPPAGIYSWVKRFPGEQVVQINHAASTTLGTIHNLKADVLHGTTHAEPDKFRLPIDGRDPATGDTGLWSDEFTAMELMNGAEIDAFWGLARWWMTMIGRGFTPTGTAVTDTHDLYSHLGGVPRTFAFVEEEHDTPASFSEAKFVDAVNTGRAVGTNGPFFDVEVESKSGETAGLGSTVRAGSGEVTVRVELDMPEWMTVDTIDVFANPDGVVTDPGEIVRDPISATKSVSVNWESSDVAKVAEGDAAHRHRSQTVEIPLEVEADAYVIVVVHDSDGEGSMWPVVPDGDVRPFGFSNPVFVDVDGNGYDNPPLAEEAAKPAPGLLVQPEPPKRKYDRKDLRKLFDAWNAHGP